MKLEKLQDSERMCCYHCGHIAKEDEPFATEYTADGEWPICPECGNNNVGGFPSYAPANIWQENDLKDIIKLHIPEEWRADK